MKKNWANQFFVYICMLKAMFSLIMKQINQNNK